MINIVRKQKQFAPPAATAEPSSQDDPQTEHRLEGFEPDNLLAFLALLGLLRALECTSSGWRPRARWDIDGPPLRPVLVLREQKTRAEIAEAAAKGCASLAPDFQFGDHKDLNFSAIQARELLKEASIAGTVRADVFSALTSDAALKDDEDCIQATSLCLLFGQGHQHFLDRLAKVPNTPSPPPRGAGKTAVELSPSECIAETLFKPWLRLDAAFSFRWDPHEDVRYALRFNDPTDTKTKERTQHGANRLAAIGFSAMTVAPQTRGDRVRLSARGVQASRRGVYCAWPIHHEPASLAAIKAMLCDRRLWSADMEHHGFVEVRRTQRISQGKFMNWTKAESGTVGIVSV